MFVDIPENAMQINQIFDTDNLAPAAWHCKYPTPFHAFHYGVHRGMKSLQSGHGATHWELLDNTRENFKKSRNRLIGFAVLGAEFVYSGKFSRRY